MFFFPAKIEDGEDPLTTLANREESEDLNEMLEDLFASVIQATDPTDANRAIHMAFRFLPSQKVIYAFSIVGHYRNKPNRLICFQRYPEYYQVIKNPLDLKSIAGKIQEATYESIQELEEDLNLMFKNAMSFNEPGSQIYKDAKTLYKLVKSKKYELEVNKVARENRGARSTRRLQGKKHFSAEVSTYQKECMSINISGYSRVQLSQGFFEK